MVDTYKEIFCFLYVLFVHSCEDFEEPLSFRVIMGVGGHKHHFNNANIEKEMKTIGDAVS